MKSELKQSSTTHDENVAKEGSSNARSTLQVEKLSKTGFPPGFTGGGMRVETGLLVSLPKVVISDNQTLYQKISELAIQLMN